MLEESTNRSLWIVVQHRNLRLNPALRQRFRRLIASLLLVLSVFLSSCDLPRVNAEDRLFLPLSLDFLGSYNLPQTIVEDTRVGGLSALAYDRQRDRFYAVSDDRSATAPARFYTLKLTLDDQSGIGGLDIEKVTILKDQAGEPYATGTLDPEGIALSPRQSVFIASEGVANQAIAPFINEFDLETGRLRGQLPIPNRYIPKVVEDKPEGVQENLGFESLTLNPGGFSTTYLEPFRVFAATESSLAQDIPDADAPDQSVRSRILHYLVGEDLPTLLSEHVYLLDAVPEGAIANGLTELLTLDQAGHFLTLERSVGLGGWGAQIFEAAMGAATDTSGIRNLNGDLTGIMPVRKRLLLNLVDLNIPLANLEGMALGPQLPDGTQSLVLVSDDNFGEAETTQFLLFRLRGWQQE